MCSAYIYMYLLEVAKKKHVSFRNLKSGRYIVYVESI